jgi:succinate dehydrogenase / fumarate reductase membrane anchor subunit
MAGSNKDFRTPLSKARGSGASGHGTEHVIHQRALAVGLLFGFIYASTSILFTTNLSHESMMGWFANPFNAAVMALVIIAAAGHFNLGIQVVIEDYIHKPTSKAALMLGINFLAALMAAIGILSILKIYLGA